MWVRRQPSLGSDCALILFLFVTFGGATVRAQNCKVLPGQIKLGTQNDYVQMLVTARLSTGDAVDVTRLAKLTIKPKLAEISATGILRPIDTT